MVVGNWSNIKNYLHDTLNKIFKNYDIILLSNYEKRKIVFEYLCNNLSYDYDLLDKIRDFNINKTPICRELYLELESVIYYQKGICNAISQYYKLLLEELGIKALCVICDDNTLVNHQLNLVYDDINDSFSFDDITSVIVGRGSMEEFFDYDISFANSVNQGNKAIIDDDYWLILPNDYINFLIGRNNVVEDDLLVFPKNIISLKGVLKK